MSKFHSIFKFTPSKIPILEGFYHQSLTFKIAPSQIGIWEGGRTSRHPIFSKNGCLKLYSIFTIFITFVSPPACNRQKYVPLPRRHPIYCKYWIFNFHVFLCRSRHDNSCECRNHIFKDYISNPSIIILNPFSRDEIEGYNGFYAKSNIIFYTGFSCR
jgi:hypothetical protein